MSKITTIEVKSLGKTHISINHGQLIFGDKAIGVELDNETILHAAMAIKEKAGQKDILSIIKSELKNRIKEYTPIYSSVDGSTRLAEAEDILEFIENMQVK